MEIKNYILVPFLEAVSRMPEEERKIVKTLLDGMIVKYRIKQMIGGLSS